jgi:hypothetical protein
MERHILRRSWELLQALLLLLLVDIAVGWHPLNMSVYEGLQLLLQPIRIFVFVVI